MTKISATIVADSRALSGDRLTTMLVTFPRFILAELNTHRMLSKNSASSRAIPFNTMVKSVGENPFIPIAWQREHKGMQGTEYFTDKVEIMDLEAQWRFASYKAVVQAKALNELGTTKQLANRLLEPFMWHTVLISGTEWDNFFNLRCPQYTTPVAGEGFYAKSWKELQSWHDSTDNVEMLEEADTLFKLQHNKGQAEIHMMALAEAIWDAMNESTPKELKAGQWHIPFGENIVQNTNIENLPDLVSGDIANIIKISTAMAARTSYTTVGDEKEFSYEKQIELHDRLTISGHYSPFEHCARVMSSEEYELSVKGGLEWTGGQYDKPLPTKGSEGWCRNYRGFIQYREILENGKI